MSTKNAVCLHRVLATKPEKVYRAFLEPDAMARWLPPNGFTGEVHEHSATVGGTYKMSFTNFTTARLSVSAASTTNWCRTSDCAMRTCSTIRTCPARYRSP